MKAPPLLPEEILRRLLRVARFDGFGVLALPGLFALLSAGSGDRTGAFIGLLIAAAGAIELHGADLLRAGESRGLRWLVTSQFYLLAAIAAYCLWRLTHVDLTFVRRAIETGATPQIREQIAAAGLTMDQYIAMTYHLGYRLLLLLTVGYQGTMIFYYLRRRAAVRRALGDDA